MFVSFLIIIVSTYLIWKVSDSFSVASNYITRNMNECIKGPTINAIASSLPELLISFFFLFYIGDIQGFSAGFATIVGSSIFNIAIIPPIAFFFIYKEKKSFPTDKKIIIQDGIFLIITEFILICALYYQGISLFFSCILIFLYITYVIYIFKKRNISNNSTQTQQINLTSNNNFFSQLVQVDLYSLICKNNKLNTLRSIIILLISIVIISICCKQLVFAAESLAILLDINLFFVTFCIIAIASSIPDTILSVKDAQDKKYKDAFSNAYASNIFDICIGVGLPVLVYLLVYDIDSISLDISSSFNQVIFTSSILLLAFTILITIIYYVRTINVFRAVIIILLYLIFLLTVYFLSI